MYKHLLTALVLSALGTTAAHAETTYVGLDGSSQTCDTCVGDVWAPDCCYCSTDGLGNSTLVWSDGDTWGVSSCEENCGTVTYTTGMTWLEVDQDDLSSVLVDNAADIVEVRLTSPYAECPTDPEPPGEAPPQR